MSPEKVPLPCHRTTMIDHNSQIHPNFGPVKAYEVRRSLEIVHPRYN
ncbi:hypothetical protein [Candidatus Ichthyocystis sparus]|nr:hypothetical protein [Candidatus Ichthyocystis sparus]